MKIKMFYDQGSASIPEDKIIYHPPFFFGVADGVSGLYSPETGPRLFHGMSGGQIAGYFIDRIVWEATFDMFVFNYEMKPLVDVLVITNGRIGELSKGHGLLLSETETLPSACFAVVNPLPESVILIQAGDSLAVWKGRDGTIGMTSNLMFTYEKLLLSIIDELMKKHHSNKQKMWEEFIPILTTYRRTFVNKKEGGFGLLNGQPEAPQFWQWLQFPRKELSLLILFTDGFVPFEWLEDEASLAKAVVSIYENDGLQKIFQAGRLAASKRKRSSHEDFPEASAVALDFRDEIR